MTDVDVVVVGAGLAGLSAARAVVAAGGRHRRFSSHATGTVHRGIVWR